LHDPSVNHRHAPATTAEAGGASLLRASALLRLAGAAALGLALWLGVLWATG